MAAFYPYDPEGYGGTDRDGVTTLDRLDLGGRMPGDVLTSIMYAGADGSVNPALSRGCEPRKAAPIDEERLRSLVRPSGGYDLGADPKALARTHLRQYQTELSQRGPVAPDPADESLRPRARPRYTSRSVIPHVTQCECKSLQDRARVRGSLKGTQMDEYTRYERDLHARDDRWFSDGDRILYEFLDMANASTLSIALIKAGVLEPPSFPLRVLAGRQAPCACSMLGPNLVHRMYMYVADDLERVFVERYNPQDRTMGATLARLNKRVTEHFAADQSAWAREDSHEARVRAMARNAETGAGSWQYEPLPAHLPSKGRVLPFTGDNESVDPLKRNVAAKIAARYGFTINDQGQLLL
jgi:hypothetical protein